MIETEHQKLHNSGKYSTFHLLERTLQLVVTVSLFSFLLCYSYGFSLFPHSFHVYFSAYLFSLFSHTIERKYMFLICNGILAFVAKSSLSPSSSSSTENKGPLCSLNEEATVVSLENVAVVDEEELKNKEEIAVAIQDEGQERESRSLYREGNEKESEALVAGNGGKEEDKGASSMKQQEEELEEVEAEAATNEEFDSTEELNRKIEDFIRKMKEEIRIEAQQQLIAV